MFIFSFIIIVALCQYITNKILNISAENTLSYTYSKRDSGILILFFITSIILQKIVPKGKTYWIGCAIFAGVLLIVMIILGTIKRIVVIKQREEIKSIFEVLEPVIPNEFKVKNKETGEFEMKDVNNMPFKLSYEGSKVNRITIKINPNTFKETVAVNLCLSLNKYLPNYEWVNEFDFAARECAFVGTPLPPRVAKYNGSWLRPTEFIPIGLSGLGEVSWNINSIKNEGRSNYIYEDGKIAKTVDTPSAPQALCVGSPLGLNTIIPTTKGYKTIGTIEIGDEVFDINNKPVKVLGKSEVNYNPDKVYHLKFSYGRNNNIDVVSDSIHNFPVYMKIINKNGPFIITTYKWKEKSAEDLELINDRIIGIDPKKSIIKSYRLTIKEEIEKEPVQCILVDSDSHLFLITDEINDNWKGGNSYPYKAVYTRNTGGGKSCYIHQEVEVKDETI